MALKSTIVRVASVPISALSVIAPSLAARLLERLFTTPGHREVLKNEREWMASAMRREIRFDGKRTLPLYSWGHGPTILLVHGWSSRASQLGNYVAPFLARGFRVVAFDQPAHGDADGKRVGLPGFADAVKRVADAIGPIHAIVAHSLGAAATTVAVANGVAPHRLVYVAPPEDLPGYLARLARIVGFPGKVATLAQQRLERRFGVLFEEARGAFLGPHIDIPLLILHDEGDVEVPIAEGQRLAATWRGPVRMVPTRGLGHNRILRNADIVRQVTEFVSADVGEEDVPEAARKAS